MTIEAIALIIITAFINYGIFNYIFYRHQKEIDAKYNNNLEELKASLDRLNFEYQTMLSRKLPMRLEVLETLCQKYVIFVRTYFDLVRPLEDYLISHSNDDTEVLKSKIEIFWESFTSTKEYYQANKMFLSKESVETISDILDTTEHIGTTVNLLADMTDKYRKPRLEMINGMIRMYKLGVDFINPDEEDSEVLYIYHLEEKHDKLSLRLEEHYKSIVGE